MKHKVIGNVEIIGPVRIYKLDAYNYAENATTVCVSTGVYPIYQGDFGCIYYLLTGKINTRFQQLGGGLFAISPFDQPEGPEVTFPSKRFSPEEWEEFINSPVCTEGDEDQRLRISLNNN